MRTIALRASDDLHFSAKSFAKENGLSLQGYIVNLIEMDLRKNGAYIQSPKNLVADWVAKLSESEATALIEAISAHGTTGHDSTEGGQT